MTLFYALFDTREHTLCWISAGHGPVYRFSSADKVIEEIPVSGIPLGIMDDAVYARSCSPSLQAGDLLAIGTDGIWEARNDAGEQYGEERFQGLICELAEQPAEDIFQAVMRSVADFRGKAPQDDDITLVIVKATC
jgi:sigma-B regulation protein RsbU (phosphoserine phosphatase)